MFVVTSNIEAKLVESLKSIKGEVGNHYALHFHLSLLQEAYKSDFQLRIAANVINDVFRKSDGMVAVGRDGDVFVLYHGGDKSLIDKAIFQLRYLFVDDPLANHVDGTENDDFCTLYDLTFQWRPFFRMCSEMLEMVTRVEQDLHPIMMTSSKGKLTPESLVRVESQLDDIDFDYVIRRQPVCGVRKGQKIRPVFHELYVNIGHLRRMLASDCDLLSNRWLFNYLTTVLDKKILEMMLGRVTAYLSAPISMNLNIDTVLSSNFAEFLKTVQEVVKPSIVIEIQIADVFSNMHAFIEANRFAQKHGCRICLDGLTTESFVQVDRESLGFDLAKMQWNADFAGDLGTEENKKLAQSVERCGSNRIILCRCDSQHAIEYGHALGISLFQGRFTDRMLDPDAVLIN